MNARVLLFISHKTKAQAMASAKASIGIPTSVNLTYVSLQYTTATE